MPPDPKRGARIRDPGALRAARLRLASCAACGRPAGGVHHVIQRGAPHLGDDVFENLVGLCGSGSHGCHGAYHGSPYVFETVRRSAASGEVVPIAQRRDHEYVAYHVGRHLATHRPDVIAYVLGKLGEDAGGAFLERNYHLVV